MGSLCPRPHPPYSGWGPRPDDRLQFDPSCYEFGDYTLRLLKNLVFWMILCIHALTLRLFMPTSMPLTPKHLITRNMALFWLGKCRNSQANH